MPLGYLLTKFFFQCLVDLRSILLIFQDIRLSHLASLLYF